MLFYNVCSNDFSRYPVPESFCFRHARFEESVPVPKPAMNLLMKRVMASAMTRGND
ncbi:MAG: hypothetical protein ACRC8Y_06300 [Chroococcales cyanobacterium]